MSASIFAKECISSNAYATGVFALGFEKDKVFLQKHPELQAYLSYAGKKEINKFVKL